MILTAILASSVCATTISGLFGFYFKKVDYKNEYRKYILNRRQKAYEFLEGLIFEFSQSKTFIDSKGNHNTPMLLHSTPENKLPITRFTNRLAEINIYSLWLTAQMNDRLSEMNTFLHKNIDQETKHESKIEEINIWGSPELIHEWENIKNKTLQQFFSDIKSLDNIKSFQKDKS